MTEDPTEQRLLCLSPHHLRAYLHGKMMIYYLVGTRRKMEEPIVVEVHTCIGYGVMA